MFKTRTYVSIALLLAVGGAVYWKTRRPDPHVRDEKNRPTPGVPAFKAAEIDELEVTDPGKPKVVLKKVAEEWRITTPVEDRADQSAVTNALEQLEKLKWRDVVAESADSHAKLQVADADTLLVVPKKGGAALATLRFGKTGRQARVGDDAKVWEVADFNRNMLVREAKMWRDREILKFEKNDVDRLEVTGPGGKVVVKREGPPPPPPDPKEPMKHKPPAGPDKWTLVEGAALIGGPLDETVPAGVLSSLTRLDAADFADGVDFKDTGLEPPRATIVAVLTDGTRKEVRVGLESGQESYVMRPESPRVWRIRKATADNLTKPFAQWRDKTLAKIEAKDLAKIELAKTGAEKLVFERVDDKTWKPTQPATIKDFDTGKVQSLAVGFQNLRAASIVEKPDPAKTGLSKPSGTVTLTKNDGSTLTLTIGAQSEKTYFVKVSGRSEVFTLNEYTVNRYFRGTADFAKSQPAPGGPGGMPAMPNMPGGRPPGM